MLQATNNDATSATNATNAGDCNELVARNRVCNQQEQPNNRTSWLLVAFSYK